MTDYYQAERQNYFFGFGSRLTPAIKLLLILNTAVYFVQLVLANGNSPTIVRVLALVPSQCIRHGAFWQPLTGLFLHGNLWQLLLDILVLWFFAPDVEFGLGGGRRLLLFYLACGVLANLVAVALVPDSFLPILGPGGSIFAILTAFATFFPQRVITLLLFFVVPVQMKAKYLVVVFGLLEWLGLMEGRFTNIASYASLAGIPLGYLVVRNHRVWESFIRKGIFAPAAKRLFPSQQDKEEFIQRKIDPILEKIARKGLHSLTWWEKRILRRAKTKIRPK